MTINDLLIIKSGKCYVSGVYQGILHVCHDLNGAKIFCDKAKAKKYIKSIKNIEFKIVYLYEEIEGEWNNEKFI